MTSETESAVLADVVVKALNDLKARDVQILEVSSMTSITDIMVIASGTSDRHVKALSHNYPGSGPAPGKLEANQPESLSFGGRTEWLAG